MNNASHYKYADGNGNVYTITHAAVAYTPVKPEESSSGSYSGGDAKSVALTPEQFDSIRAILEKAIGNPANHIKDRVKMSGVISVINGEKREQYIIRPGSAEIVAVESALKAAVK